MAAQVLELTPDGRTPEQQWQAILNTVHQMIVLQMDCFKTKIRPALKQAGVSLVHHKNLDRSDQKHLRQYFQDAVLPVLTPLAVDPGHPFPFISNLSLSLAVITRRVRRAEPTFVRVKVPSNRSRLVRLQDALVFVPLEQIVEANLDLLFPKVDIICRYPFRVTRNADVKRNEEEANDLLEMIRDELRMRRFATVVRLEVDSRMPKPVRRLLAHSLEIQEEEIFEIDGLIDFRALLPLTELDRPELKLKPWIPRSHPRLRQRSEDGPIDIFREVSEKDVLIHHPYHSFSETVQRFIQEAAEDPQVLAIKMVIYRTARESQTLRALLRAVERGKQVAVTIELRARFDEELNIKWVNILEQAGIHVSYGIVGVKIHAKITMVVREEGGSLHRYVHISTGNYHSETAKIYTDLGLLTADQECGQDVGDLFNLLTGHAGHNHYRKLLVAPADMRERFIQLIRQEARMAARGKKARILAKMNSLEDPQMIRELYEASRAGVKIDLLVRGICCLRPGLKGISENISIVSIVGRFLEHSRVFCFWNDGRPLYYIGSADWMHRNLDCRVETMVPIEDEDLKKELDNILETLLSDNRKVWDMSSDGSYRQRQPKEGAEERNGQEKLMLETEKG